MHQIGRGELRGIDDGAGQNGPVGDIQNDDDTCWPLNACGFYAWVPRECGSVQTLMHDGENQSYHVIAAAAMDRSLRCTSP